MLPFLALTTILFVRSVFADDIESGLFHVNRKSPYYHDFNYLHVGNNDWRRADKNTQYHVLPYVQRIYMKDLVLDIPSFDKFSLLSKKANDYEAIVNYELAPIYYTFPTKDPETGADFNLRTPSALDFIFTRTLHFISSKVGLSYMDINASINITAKPEDDSQCDGIHTGSIHVVYKYNDNVVAKANVELTGFIDQTVRNVNVQKHASTLVMGKINAIDIAVGIRTRCPARIHFEDVGVSTLPSKDTEHDENWQTGRLLHQALFPMVSASPFVLSTASNESDLRSISIKHTANWDAEAYVIRFQLGNEFLSQVRTKSISFGGMATIRNGGSMHMHLESTTCTGYTKIMDVAIDSKIISTKRLNVDYAHALSSSFLCFPIHVSITFSERFSDITASDLYFLCNDVACGISDVKITSLKSLQTTKQFLELPLATHHTSDFFPPAFAQSNISAFGGFPASAAAGAASHSRRRVRLIVGLVIGMCLLFLIAFIVILYVVHRRSLIQHHVDSTVCATLTYDIESRVFYE